MGRNLTNTDLIVIIVLVVNLVILNFISLFSFYRDYEITNKFKNQKITYLDVFLAYYARLSFSLALIISLYLIYYKNISTFLEVLLILLIFKSISYFFLLDESLKFFGLDPTKKTDKRIKQMKTYDRIFTNILVLFFGMYIIKRLLS
jgi:hypothetical protein